MHIVFDTLNIYYLPQYLPISEVLLSRGHKVTFVCYTDKTDKSLYTDFFSKNDFEHRYVENDRKASDYYAQVKPQWVFFGNAFSYLDKLHEYSKSAQLGHGVGPKPGYYHKSKTPMSVRFMEGDLRLKKIREFYPNDEFVQVGFSKLDPLFNNTQTGLDFNELGLDSNKKTILYAPTFNPSSLERFPDNWPSDFANYNILIKPHGFTYTREKYHKQRDKLRKWSAFQNAYVATPSDISLLPFMADADILLSEASSTLFEFVALSKPVIVCNFFQLKWNYKGIFKFRYHKRFGKDNVLYKDIGQHIDSYKELAVNIKKQLNHPELFKAERERYTQEHVGPTDGQASVRIVDYLEKHRL
jgi:hypothetical protein